MRLIDADALKLEFNYQFGGVSHAVAAARLIDAAPTIHEKKHGHWIEYLDGCSLVKCSCCGHEYLDCIECMNYCGNCGAIMDEKVKFNETN